MIPHRSSRGFTLTELLVTLVIIVALACIAVPAGLGIRRKAHRAACLSNLRQIGIVLETYIQDNGSRLPEWQPGRRSKNEEGLFMETALAPPLAPETFHCPADSKQFAASGSSYIWNTTQNGRNRSDLVFFGKSGEPARIPLVSDKEGWHSGDPAVNFLYADMSASAKVHFGVNDP